MGHYLLKDSPKTGTGDLLVSVQAMEPYEAKYNHLLSDLLNRELRQKTVEVEMEINDIVFEMYGLSPSEREYVASYVKKSLSH